jgi:hypothetical protein
MYAFFRSFLLTDVREPVSIRRQIRNETTGLLAADQLFQARL